MTLPVRAVGVGMIEDQDGIRGVGLIIGPSRVTFTPSEARSVAAAFLVAAALAETTGPIPAEFMADPDDVASIDRAIAAQRRARA